MENSSTQEVSKGDDISIDQLVTFKLADEELAVPIRLVQEIIRVPDITRVPAAPNYLDGIGNLRGDLLPIVNLRKRLGLDPRQIDDQTRVVVLRSSVNPTGIVVDSVSEVMSIDRKVLEDPPSSFANVDEQYLKSIAKIDDGKRLILILNERMMLPDIVWENAGVGMNLSSENSEKKAATKLSTDTEQLVTFNVGEEEYAIGIMQVKEIIRITEITPVPKAPKYIIGMMALRNHLLPIMDLRIRFGINPSRDEKNDQEKRKSEETHRIVVVDLNGILTGIKVDSVSQVLTVEKSKIENPPSIVKSDETDCLRGVGKLDGGKRILMLLDVSRLILEGDQSSIQAVTEGGQKVESAINSKEVTNDEAQLVCFKVDSEEFALDIMKVQEIIRLKEITSVPHAKTYMEGIINLRGTVVPVIDMRKRFGLGKAERNNHNRIVIVNIQGKVSGLIVDAVSEVIRMQKQQIEGAPKTVSDFKDKYIEGVGKLNEGKRILILIKAEALLEEHENSAS